MQQPIKLLIAKNEWNNNNEIDSIDCHNFLPRYISAIIEINIYDDAD